MKLVSLVSLDPHCILILVASLSPLQIPREVEVQAAAVILGAAHQGYHNANR